MCTKLILLMTLIDTCPCISSDKILVITDEEICIVHIIKIILLNINKEDS